MRFSFLVSALCLNVGLGACQRTSPDGLSIAGHIQPFKSVTLGHSLREELTDASAYLTALQDILVKAPPVDESSPNSTKEWTRFYETAKLKITGNMNRLLFNISCAADSDGILGPLSYSALNKNVTVRIYTGSENQANEADRVRQAISHANHVILYHVKMEILGLNGVESIEDSGADLPKPLRDELVDLEETAGSLKLSGGTVIEDNSPIGDASAELELSLATASMEASKERLRIAQGRPFSVKAVEDVFEKERTRWQFYPDSQLPEPFWRRAIPYGDDPKNLCLLGEFEDVDLTHRPDQISAFINPKAKLIGVLTHWYLVKRSSFQVVAQGDAPKKPDPRS